MDLRRTPQCYATTRRVIKVVNSCVTVEQLRVALNMMKQIKEPEQWQYCVEAFVEQCSRVPTGYNLLHDLSFIHYDRISKQLL